MDKKLLRVTVEFVFDDPSWICDQATVDSEFEGQWGKLFEWFSRDGELFGILTDANHVNITHTGFVNERGFPLRHPR